MPSLPKLAGAGFGLALGLAAGSAAAVSLTFGSGPAAAAEATVIELTQTACQFVESENGIERGFTTARKADCEAINASTAAQRLAESETITVKAGSYVFRVTNRDVPYDLGFWIREEDYDWRNPLHKVSKTSVSGGGLKTGVTKDYAVELKPGRYTYSCPLNTTPDYTLVVTE